MGRSYTYSNIQGFRTIQPFYSPSLDLAELNLIKYPLFWVTGIREYSYTCCFNCKVIKKYINGHYHFCTCNSLFVLVLLFQIFHHFDYSRFVSFPWDPGLCVYLHIINCSPYHFYRPFCFLDDRNCYHDKQPVLNVTGWLTDRQMESNYRWVLGYDIYLSTVDKVSYNVQTGYK